eukprot:sb/3464169/
MVQLGGGNHGDEQQLLASCSDDNTICIHNVTPSTDQTPVLKAHQTLTGHTARITDVSWNPHLPKQVVSSCYDGTAQVWDVETGEGLASYRGHVGRVFSVTWSHTDISTLYSGSDEFTVRSWDMEQCELKTPPETNPLAPGRNATKGGKKKKKKVQVKNNSDSTTWRKPAAPVPLDPRPVPVVEENGVISVVEPVKDEEPAEEVVVLSDSRKKRTNRGRSLLPLTARLDHSGKAEQMSQIITLAKELYGTNEDDKTTEPVVTGLYSSRDSFLSLVATERATHTQDKHHHQAAMLGIWCGDVTTTLTTAIATRTVTETLLSAAAMVCGRDLYRAAVSCYISQLRESRDFVSAATYMLLLNEVHPAIDMLVKEDCYREAIAIAKLRLSPTHPKISEIYRLWAGKQEREMQLDSAVKCHLAVGDPKRAVLVMLRRKDRASLEGAAEIVETRTNQNSLCRSRDWLSANQGPVFPDLVGSWLKQLDLLYFSLLSIF